MKGDLKKIPKTWFTNRKWTVEVGEDKFVEFEEWEHAIILSELLKSSASKPSKSGRKE